MTSTETAVLEVGTIRPDFSMVEPGRWLHKSAPVWVVKYDGIPGTSHRYDSWQAFRATKIVPAGRKPWTIDNKRIGHEDGYATEAEAFEAASQAANSYIGEKS